MAGGVLVGDRNDIWVYAGVWVITSLYLTLSSFEIFGEANNRMTADVTAPVSSKPPAGTLVITEVASFLMSEQSQERDFPNSRPLSFSMATNDQIKGPDQMGSEQSPAEITSLIVTGRYQEARELGDLLIARFESVGVETIDFSTALLRRGEVLILLADYKGAQADLARSLGMRKVIAEASEQDVAEATKFIGNLYLATGEPRKAEKEYKQALAIYESFANERESIVCKRNIATALRNQGWYKRADGHYEQITLALKDTYGSDHPETLNAVMHHAKLKMDLGRYKEAEADFMSVRNARQRTLREGHPDRADSDNTLGLLYVNKGQWGEGRSLLEEALSIRMRVFPEGHYLIGQTLNGLGGAYERRRDWTIATKYYTEAIAVSRQYRLRNELETSYIEDMALGNLARVHMQEKAYEKAISIYSPLIERYEANERSDKSQLMVFYRDLGRVFYRSGRYDEAEEFYEKSLSLMSSILGEGSIFTADVANNLGKLEFKRRSYKKASNWYQISIDAVLEQLFFQPGEVRNTDKQALSVIKNYKLPNWYELQVQLNKELGGNPELIGSHFLAWQAVKESRVGKALMESAKTMSLPDQIRTAKEGIERARDDVEEFQRILINERKRPNADRKAKRETLLEDLIAERNAMVRNFRQEIAKSDVDYAEMAMPELLGLDEAVSLLRPKEAIIVFAQVGKNGQFVAFIADSEGNTDAVPLSGDGEYFLAAVTRLRSGVTIPAGSAFDIYTLAGLKFDMEASKRLYDTLFDPLTEHLQDIEHVLIVPDGPLESLPFSLLVKQISSDDGGDVIFGEYRESHWLIDDLAISVLPTVQSLAAVRRGVPSSGEFPFLGIGNPKLGALLATSEIGKSNISTLLTLGSDPSTGKVDAIRALPNVPSTEEALEEIMLELGGKRLDLLVGERATERAVRRLNNDNQLRQYRMVAFSTHALVAGELSDLGLNEPALVLTPPTSSDDVEYSNDGLLRASEIVSLSFDADWILLAACNTAASDGTLGAEPLSGLAKSFFYAGSRSLLVSHWPAEARVTSRIVPAVVRRSENGTPRAKALQQIMREIRLDQGTNTTNTRYLAHPALWATFTIVGEAG